MVLNSMYMLKNEEIDEDIYEYQQEFELLCFDDSPIIPGILDMPFVRPQHLGSSLEKSEYLSYFKMDLPKEPVTKKPLHLKNSLNYNDTLSDFFDIQNVIIPVANKLYSIYDAKVLSDLGLRKGEKEKKDKERVLLLKRYLEQTTSEEKNIILEKKSNNLSLDRDLGIDTKLDFINVLKLAQIIKYIAPPDISDLLEIIETKSAITNGFIKCPEKSIIEISDKIHLKEMYLEMDTGNVFNYKNRNWTKCDKKYYEITDKYDCDLIYNIYDYRFSPAGLKNWNTKNSLQYKTVNCILSQVNLYLNKIQKKTDLFEKNKMLGKLLFGFRDSLIENLNSTEKNIKLTRLLARNILIYCEGLRIIKGNFSKVSVEIYEKLKNLAGEISGVLTRRGKRSKQG